MWWGVLSGRNLVGRIGPRFLFSFHFFFAYPCTISRIDHGHLEEDIENDLPLIHRCGKGATLTRKLLSLKVPWEQITIWSLKDLNGQLVLIYLTTCSRDTFRLGFGDR